MTEPNMRNVMTAMSEDAKRGPLARTMTVARSIAIVAAVAGATPTLLNLYHSWRHGIPFSDVSHRLAQYDLWVKNIDCKIDYRSLAVGQGLRIDAGACPRSRDIALKMTTQEGAAAHEWIAFDKLQKASSARAAWLELIVSSAQAAETPQAGRESSGGKAPSPPDATGAVDRLIRLAQAGDIKVVCQSLQGQSVVRVVSEAGKCYREVFSPFLGRVEKREEVPCSTQCPAPKG